MEGGGPEESEGQWGLLLEAPGGTLMHPHGSLAQVQETIRNQGRVSGCQRRRRMGHRRRLQRHRAAATPTPPVTATIAQW